MKCPVIQFSPVLCYHIWRCRFHSSLPVMLPSMSQSPVLMHRRIHRGKGDRGHKEVLVSDTSIHWPSSSVARAGATMGFIWNSDWDSLEMILLRLKSFFSQIPEKIFFSKTSGSAVCRWGFDVLPYPFLFPSWSYRPPCLRLMSPFYTPSPSWTYFLSQAACFLSRTCFP